MGSPKPATRMRRQKPAAPNPPVNRASFSGGKIGIATVTAQQPLKEEVKDSQENILKVTQPSNSRPAALSDVCRFVSACSSFHRL